MKPPSNVKTPAQYIASLPADRAKTIATVRALVNKHIPRGYAVDDSIPGILGPLGCARVLRLR
jgi:hypothetical protein